MPLNLDKMAMASSTSALRNFASDEFSISVSGVIAVSGSGTWSGSVPFARSTSLVRLYLKQTPVPSGIAVDYTAADLLPCPPYGSFGMSPFVWVGCSVAGSPGVTSVDADFKVQFTATGLAVTITINNFAAGAMTLTATTFTIRYVAFLPT